VLVYDSDQAGIKAAQRSVAVFQKGLLNARILVLPKGHDPDSFLIDHGPDDFLKAAEKSMGMIPFMVETAVNNHGLSVDGKVRIVNDLQPAILAIGDPVARSLRIKQLAERIGVDEAVVLQKIRRPMPTLSGAGRLTTRNRSVPPSTSSPQRGERYRLERQVVAMMLQFPEMIDVVREKRLMDQFADTMLAEIGRGIIEYFSRTGGDVAGLVSLWEDQEKKALVSHLSLVDERWGRDGCMGLINQFEAGVRRRDKDLLRRIEAAEKSGDNTLLAQLLREKQHQASQTMNRRSDNQH
jgi:DNA primase